MSEPDLPGPEPLVPWWFWPLIVAILTGWFAWMVKFPMGMG